MNYVSIKLDNFYKANVKFLKVGYFVSTYFNAAVKFYRHSSHEPTIELLNQSQKTENCFLKHLSAYLAKVICICHTMSLLNHSNSTRIDWGQNFQFHMSLLELGSSEFMQQPMGKKCLPTIFLLTFLRTLIFLLVLQHIALDFTVQIVNK